MCCRYCFSTLLSRQRHWAWASFPVPEGTVPPTDVLPATSEMDSCAACCCCLCKAGSAGEGSRTVLGNNPSSSPCLFYFLNSQGGYFPYHPLWEFGLNFSWLFFFAETDSCPPKIHAPFPSPHLSLESGYSARYHRSCRWVPPCDWVH